MKFGIKNNGFSVHKDTYLRHLILEFWFIVLYQCIRITSEVYVDTFRFTFTDTSWTHYRRFCKTDMKSALGDADSWLDLGTLLYIPLPPSKEEWVHQPDYKEKRVLQRKIEVSNNKYHGRVFNKGVHFVDSHLYGQSLDMLRIF